MNRARVRIYTDRVNEQVVDIVDEAIDAGLASAERLVPVDTGDLQADLDVIEPAHVVGDRVTGSYGVTGDLTDYGEHVEFGTERAPAQPYLRPSMDAMRQALR